MNSGKGVGPILLGAAVIITSILLGFTLGADFVGSNLRERAIKERVARWTVNPETGDTEFVYGCEHGGAESKGANQ